MISHSLLMSLCFYTFFLGAMERPIDPDMAQALHSTRRRPSFSHVDDDYLKINPAIDINHTYQWVIAQMSTTPDNPYKEIREEDVAKVRANLGELQSTFIPETLRRYTQTRNKGWLQVGCACLLGLTGGISLVYGAHEGIWALIQYIGSLYAQDLLDQNIINSTFNIMDQACKDMPTSNPYVTEFKHILPDIKTDITAHTQYLQLRYLSNAKLHASKALITTFVGFQCLCVGSWAGISGISNICTAYKHKKLLHQRRDRISLLLSTPPPGAQAEE